MFKKKLWKKLYLVPTFLSNLNLVIMFSILTIKSLRFIQVLNWALYHFIDKVNDFLFVTCVSFDTTESISTSNLMIFPLTLQI
jgi:hypothetical protein